MPWNIPWKGAWRERVVCGHVGLGAGCKGLPPAATRMEKKLCKGKEKLYKGKLCSLFCTGSIEPWKMTGPIQRPAACWVLRTEEALLALHARSHPVAECENIKEDVPQGLGSHAQRGYALGARTAELMLLNGRILCRDVLLFLAAYQLPLRQLF